MINRCLSLLFIGLMIFSASSQTLRAQTGAGDDSARTAKVKAAVLKRGVNAEKKVNVKLPGGAKLKGFISRVGDDSFTLTDSKTRQANTLAYRDVAKVSGNGLSIGAKIGIGVGVLAAVMFVALVVSTNGNLGGL
jgi:hypothetical protein